MKKIKRILLSIWIFFIGIARKYYVKSMVSLYGIENPKIDIQKKQTIISAVAQRISAVMIGGVTFIVTVLGLFIFLNKKMAKKKKVVVACMLILAGIMGALLLNEFITSDTLSKKLDDTFITTMGEYYFDKNDNTGTINRATYIVIPNAVFSFLILGIVVFAITKIILNEELSLRRTIISISLIIVSLSIAIGFNLKWSIFINTSEKSEVMEIIYGALTLITKLIIPLLILIVGIIISCKKNISAMGKIYVFIGVAFIEIVYFLYLYVCFDTLNVASKIYDLFNGYYFQKYPKVYEEHRIYRGY